MSSKRRAAKAGNRIKTSNVESLNVHDLVITNLVGKTFRLKRLLYREVPSIVTRGQRKGEFIGGSFEHAQRDDVVRKIYQALEIDSDGVVARSPFKHIASAMVIYFRYLDEFAPDEPPLDLEVMKRSIRHFLALKKRGITPTNAHSVKSALSYLLKQMNRVSEAQELPGVNRGKPSDKLGALDAEKELKPVSHALIKAHKLFVNSIENNVPLNVHPLWNEELFDKNAKEKNWNETQKMQRKDAFRRAMLPGYPGMDDGVASYTQRQKFTLFNHATLNALHLFFMMTGMNTEPMMLMSISDVEFRSVGSGKYIFNAVKGRARYGDIDNALGFSLRTRSLIEDWLSLVKTMYECVGIKEQSSDLPLFPYFNSRSSVLFWTHAGDTSRINIFINYILGIRVNPTRFRKTKADLLMRVTQDVHLVSLSLNNSIEVVQSNYSMGMESDHKSNISAVMEAQYQMSAGESVAESVSNAKVLHSDILLDYDYKERLRGGDIKATTITPSGIRCKGDKGKASQVERKIKSHKIDMPKNERRCTNFLSCFDCENHVLVASEHDIWLMLSFHEQVLAMLDIPSQNSMPKDDLYQIEALLSGTLSRLKNKSNEHYQKAEKRLSSDGYHPLYENLRSLSSTLETFNV